MSCVHMETAIRQRIYHAGKKKEKTSKKTEKKNKIDNGHSIR